MLVSVHVTVMDFLTIIITIVVCVIASLAWYWHRQHQKYDHLPGPPRDSFWSGHVPSIQRVIAEGGIIDDYYLEISKTYGLIFRLCLWNQTFVVVLDPEHIKEVMVTGNLPKSRNIYSQLNQVFGARFLGLGLESETDQKRWIVQRMHLDHWFKPHHLHEFVSEMNEFADRLLAVMEKNTDGTTEVPMGELFQKVTTYLLTKVAFNFDLGELGDHSHPFMKDMAMSLSGFTASIGNPFLAMNPFNWGYCQKVRKATASLRKYARDLIIDRKETKQRGDYIPYDLLECMLELEEKHPATVTEDVVLDHFTTFLIAGQETTANTLSFMVLILAQHPDCYKRLQQEIDSNIGAMSVITPREIDNLPYLDMVMKESLRMYPVAKFSSRETAHEHEIGGYKLPAGTDIMLSFYATSRSEKNIKDPLKFMPERFDPKNPERLGRYHSTPFSIGPHTCIGRKFAEIEAKIIMIKILQNLDFELVPGQSMGVLDQGTLQPKGGAICFLRPRKVNAA